MSATLTEHWHELVTVALLGTDRRDPPEPPPGLLADLVDDAVVATPSARMLAAVGGCVAARRAGLTPRAPVAPPVPAPLDDRPLVASAAARRWWSLIVTWPVLEDEWLATVERAGQRLPPDVLVGLLRRHRTDAARRARVRRIGGPLADWLLEHQPDLSSSVARRPAPAVDELPALAVPPELLPLLTAGPAIVVPAVVAGFRDGAFGIAHRAVLVNFVARMRPDALLPLAAALGGAEVPYAAAGLAQSLAELAADACPHARGAVVSERVFERARNPTRSSAHWCPQRFDGVALSHDSRVHQ